MLKKFIEIKSKNIFQFFRFFSLFLSDRRNTVEWENSEMADLENNLSEF